MKAVELDPRNEYALSNIGVIYLKRLDYDNCLKYTDASLAIIDAFMNDTKDFNKDNLLEVKLLMRRSKCYEMKNEFEKAKEDLDKAMMLDPQNAAVKQSLARV